MKKILLLLFSLLLIFKNTKANDDIDYLKLWQFIISNEIKYPEIVFAQAILESGHFKSTLFENHNNLFGMKYPSIRKTLAVGKSKSGYAKFEDWSASVLDYKLWQDMFIEKNNIQNKNQYLSQLNKKYAENKSYVSMLNKIVKKFSYL
jgi:uncharacterized FlgJ-related protein